MMMATIAPVGAPVLSVGAGAGTLRRCGGISGDTITGCPGSGSGGCSFPSATDRPAPQAGHCVSPGAVCRPHNGHCTLLPLRTERGMGSRIPPEPLGKS